MTIISAEQVFELLDMKSCITLMKQTLSELSEGKGHQVLRSKVEISDGNLLGLMPAVMEHNGIAGVKLLSIFPENYKYGLPSHQGVVVLFDTTHGHLKTVVDADAVTAVRTAAVSGAVTDVLARRDAKTLAILGAGLQGRMHVEAMLSVRDIQTVYVWDKYPEYAEKFVEEMADKYGITVLMSENVADAVSDADIICTVTAAKEPILFGEDIKSGAHINAVGACAKNARELSSSCVKRGAVYCDNTVSAMNEAGDILIPIANGEVTADILKGEVGDVFLGKLEGRTSPDEITIFESLGIAMEDLAAANFVHEQLLSRQSL